MPAIDVIRVGNDIHLCPKDKPVIVLPIEIAEALGSCRTLIDDIRRECMAGGLTRKESE
jgi:hypothetical protein